MDGEEEYLILLNSPREEMVRGRGFEPLTPTVSR